MSEQPITNVADAVRELGALPMPAGSVPQRVGADPRVELIRKERTHCEIAPFESEDERPLHVWGPSQYPTREMCQRCTVMRDWAEDPDATDVVLLAEIDRLLAERHSTNESLSLAAETLRENRDRIAELEALTPARHQTCRVCGAGYVYGEPCAQCAFRARMAAEAQARVRQPYRVGHDLPGLGGVE